MVHISLSSSEEEEESYISHSSSEEEEDEPVIVVDPLLRKKVRVWWSGEIPKGGREYYEGTVYACPEPEFGSHLVVGYDDDGRWGPTYSWLKGKKPVLFDDKEAVVPERFIELPADFVFVKPVVVVC
jgi:hypothetical protein